MAPPGRAEDPELGARRPRAALRFRSPSCPAELRDQADWRAVEGPRGDSPRRARQEAGNVPATHARATRTQRVPRAHAPRTGRATLHRSSPPSPSAVRAAAGTAGRRGPRGARPFDVRRRRGDWPDAYDVRGLRWAGVLRLPQRPPRLGLWLPGI